MENFYIGQDIVAICNHSQGRFKEGDIFPVKGLKQGCCKNTPLLIDIGLISNSMYNMCPCCNKIEREDDNSAAWYCSSLFKPLDSLVNISELTEVLSEPLFEVR